MDSDDNDDLVLDTARGDGVAESTARTTLDALSSVAASKLQGSVSRTRTTDFDLDTQLDMMYRALINWTDEEDRNHRVCEYFMSKPSGIEYPSYYSVITHPIALDDIKTKIDLHTYTSLDQMMVQMRTRSL
jgi:hypothetical protein